MNDDPKPVGSFSWADLTVNDAKQVKDFYCSVVGWTPEPLAMGEYDDFCMRTPHDGQTVAGICHARGVNAKLPAQWLIYIYVDDLGKSLEQCRALGGTVLDGPRDMGESRFAVIQDPAGACAALFQQ